MERWLLPRLIVVLVLFLGGAAFAANPYPPPASGSARVDPSRIRVGECAVFSGDGFASESAVAVDDNGVAAGTARADARGRFSKQLCYGADARRGRHVLTGTGTAPGNQPLSVSAVLIVEGVRQNAGGPSGSSGGSVAEGESGSSGNKAPDGSAGPGGVVGINEPGAVSGPGVPPGSNAGTPVEGDNVGLWRIGAGLLGLLVAMALSWWLLLLARRRKRDDDKGNPSMSPSPA